MAGADLLVRAGHLAAMALVVGGAALLAALAARGGERDRALLLAAARPYEALFWGAVGLALVTGVGNLGALGEVPGPATPWGALLTAKLLAVFAGLPLAMLRTLLAAGLAARPEAPARAWALLGVAYGATAAGALAIAGAGMVLAHG